MIGDRPADRSPTDPGARRLRVTYMIDKLHRAGAQVHLGQLASSLDREAFEPEVVCLLAGGPVADGLRADGVPVEVLGLGRLYAPRATIGLWRLARRLRSRRVDVLHTYLVSANVFGTLAGRLAGVGAVVTSRRDMGFSRNVRLRLVEEWLVNPLVDKVVAVSPAVAEATRRERGWRDDQVVTIPNGVDLQRFDAARHPRPEARAQALREWGLADDEVAVGAIGHLSPVKGHADLLEAAARIVARHPRTRFLLVGDGPLRAELEAHARRLGLRERVVFAGVREDVARILALLDVVVLPSHTEGLSNVLLESMAMARPVVATAVGGNPDVLRDGVSGRLVPARDPEALAAAVLELVLDPGRARAMGREARRVVEGEFSRQRMVEAYEALYRALPRRGVSP
jgi:glycosyltransferase involved in cell wall biosynthesis